MSKLTKEDLQLMGDKVDPRLEYLLGNYDRACELVEADGDSYKHMPDFHEARGAIVNYIDEQAAERVKDAEMHAQFYLMSELQLLMMPLMIHSYQRGFPSMSAQILKELWEWRNNKFNEAVKVVLPDRKDENEQNN